MPPQQQMRPMMAPQMPGMMPGQPQQPILAQHQMPPTQPAANIQLDPFGA